MKMHWRPMTKKILRRMGTCLVALVLVGVFYLAVVLGQPQPSDQPAQPLQNQPLLAASPALNVSAGENAEPLLYTFPVPALYAAPGAALALESGSSYDLAYENGFARMVELHYAAPVDGQNVKLTVQTIYPARALTLLPKGDYRIASAQSQALAGMQAVRMENGNSIRLHVQAEEAIYTVKIPATSNIDIDTLLRSLQLYAKEK